MQVMDRVPFFAMAIAAMIALEIVLFACELVKSVLAM